jgi:hypothetical protein
MDGNNFPFLAIFPYLLFDYLPIVYFMMALNINNMHFICYPTNKYQPTDIPFDAENELYI